MKNLTKFENFRQIELNEKRNQNVQLEILIREDSASELQIHCLLLKVIHPAKIYTDLLLYLLEIKSILTLKSIKHQHVEPNSCVAVTFLILITLCG